MTNVNNFAIIGHLTADAEEFNIGNNTYVSFRVAVNRGQNKDASFIPSAPRRSSSATPCVPSLPRVPAFWFPVVSSPATTRRMVRKSSMTI